jgi:hypothetical protein
MTVPCFLAALASSTQKVEVEGESAAMTPDIVEDLHALLAKRRSRSKSST